MDEQNKLLAEFLRRHFGEDIDTAITPENSISIAIALLEEYSARRWRLLIDGHRASELSRLLADNLRRSRVQ